MAEDAEEEAPLSERAERVRLAIEENRAAVARIQSEAQGHIDQATEQLEEDYGRMEQTEERIQRRHDR